MLLPRLLLGVAALASAVPATADLAEVKSRGARRVIVVGVRSGDEFFAPAGAQPGFDREVLDRFASLQRVRLDVVPAASWDALIPDLLAGKGDLIENLRRTPTWSRLVVKYFGERAPEVLKKACTDLANP